MFYLLEKNLGKPYGEVASTPLVGPRVKTEKNAVIFHSGYTYYNSFKSIEDTALILWS